LFGEHGGKKKNLTASNVDWRIALKLIFKKLNVWDGVD
jgi:hypothetical protein